MIVHERTRQVMTMSTHPHDNWMGEGWLVVPEEVEDLARETSPFLLLLRGGDGRLMDIAVDEEAKRLWELEEEERTR